jgi:hypothetical protein
VQLRRSAEFIWEANARFFGHTTCPSPVKEWCCNCGLERVVGGVGFASGSSLGMFSPIRLPPHPVAQKNFFAAMEIISRSHLRWRTYAVLVTEPVAGPNCAASRHPPYQISLLPDRQAMFDPRSTGAPRRQSVAPVAPYAKPSNFRSMPRVRT